MEVMKVLITGIGPNYRATEVLLLRDVIRGGYRTHCIPSENPDFDDRSRHSSCGRSRLTNFQNLICFCVVKFLRFAAGPVDLNQLDDSFLVQTKPHERLAR